MRLMASRLFGRRGWSWTLAVAVDQWHEGGFMWQVYPCAMHMRCKCDANLRRLACSGRRCSRGTQFLSCAACTSPA